VNKKLWSGKHTETKSRLKCGKALFPRQILPARHHFTVTGVNGRVMLKRIIKRHVVRVWTGFVWLRVATSGGCMTTVINIPVP
jgi:hypothetical protein